MQVEVIKYQTDEQKENREQEFAAQLQAKDSEICRLKQEHHSVQQKLSQAVLLIEVKDKFITGQTERIKADELQSEQLLQKQNAALSQKDREISQLQATVKASEIQSQSLIQEKQEAAAKMQAKDSEMTQLKQENQSGAD